MMKWFAKAVKFLGKVLGIASDAADVVEAGEVVFHEVKDFSHTQPSGRQLSPNEVREQQRKR